MRILSSLFALALSLPAFAGQPVLEVTPESPIVMESNAIYDGHVLVAPWFMVKAKITNNSTQTLMIGDFLGEVDPTMAKEVSVVYAFPTQFGEAVLPGATYEKTLYFDRLPPTMLNLYEVELSVSTADGQPVEAVQFVTQ